jgi:cytochrome bd-type quinol oxidase subunit 2
MLVALALAGLALRTGLAVRRRRSGSAPLAPTGGELRRRHLRLAKPAVVMVLVGFLGGPISAVFLRDWDPFASFHGWLGLLAAALFAAAAALGHRIEEGRSRAFDAHALLGMLALLFAAVTAVAGFVLLP